jgi:RES domain-containing protein
MPTRPDLSQVLDDLGATSWTGDAYRHTAPQYHPLSGTGAAALGGRWNPKGVSTIYLAMPKEACVAEFIRMAEGQARGVSSFLPRDLHTVAVRGLDVLGLDDEERLARVGLGLRDIQASNRSACQEVGEAAHYLGLQGVLAPSATETGLVLAVFERNMRRGQLELVESEPIGPLLSQQG